jgi:hypothetical protein
VVILRQTVIADGPCCFGIQCAGILCIPVKLSSGIGHLIVNISGANNPFGNIGRVNSNYNIKQKCNAGMQY